MDLTVNLHRPHPKQAAIKASNAKRRVIRAGRRSGKTTIISDIAIESFLARRRVLYATPTDDQLERFWFLSKLALKEPLDSGIYYKNETRHVIELEGTEQRIRAKTAYDADTLRGDYGDLVILDEFQDMDPDALEDVIWPMLLDNDGDLIVIYTSKRKRGSGLATAHKLFKRAKEDTSGRWEAFKFTSHDNPHLSRAALAEITGDMTSVSYRAEIMAEELDDDPNALWNRTIIDHVIKFPALSRIVVGVDPPGSVNTECGIIVAGNMRIGDEKHAYVIEDPSVLGSPAKWGRAVVTAYHRNLADRVCGEANYGGDMVENTIKTVKGGKEVAYKSVRATRGKAVRAEPIVALYESGLVHHVGEFENLENELCSWVPDSGMPSPNRLDGLVWALTELMIEGGEAPAGEVIDDIDTGIYKSSRRMRLHG